MEQEQRIDRAVHMFKAIAHPIRLQIVLLLRQRKELTATTIQEYLEVDQSLTSHHLLFMKSKGLLTTRRQRKNVYYSLVEPGLANSIAMLLDTIAYAS
ncbi:transcriptional regulator, ArsR family [Fibrisoma limi BUZ 3]|uniref:Transcriptional regulator, ArsR family n=1 Tax=Fibrisoma limi BUZ 3 TaxID=1185876 RepID=I2GRH3_9BACT|nr:metalloregulator ArsR/SmtB family transcription factor [Fibrisoma limi]CCH56501.1 transcriptional regulator, ArsR family [Fibrisoma limi BUZ 3]